MIHTGLPGVPRGVAFIGAMNRDLVFMGPVPGQVQHEFQTQGLRYEPYRETLIEDQLAERIVQLVIGQGEQVDQLGGSAFNVARTLRQVDPDIRLGFVSVAGSLGASRPHLEFLEHHRIEATFVAKRDEPTATSLSFVSDGDRTLLTTIGCNRSFPEHLRSNTSRLVDYLSGFEVVHVTSLLDDSSAGLPGTLFETMRERGAVTRISVDPGTAWAKKLDAGVRRLIEQTDVLHLNSDEFDTMAGRLAAESVDAAVGRVLALMRKGGQMLARSHAGATVYESVDGRTRSVASVRNVVFPDERVVDATGAGDSFVAGFLAARYVPRIHTGVEVGIAVALAGRKVTQRGPLTRQDCEEVLGSFGPGPGRRGEMEP